MMTVDNEERRDDRDASIAFLFCFSLLAAAGCGQECGDATTRGGRPCSRTVPRGRQPPDASMAARVPGRRRPSAPPPGPKSPTAAPGVAFNYRYAFRLPAERVAEVQEQHAQACEQLGVARCRITGMLYRLVNDDDIEAMLAFKLDPAHRPPVRPATGSTPSTRPRAC